MKNFICLLVLFSSFTAAYTQEDTWDVYMAEYEKGPGSVVLNMSLKNIAPVKALPYVLVTGVTYKGCMENGMPTKTEFEKLYVVSDRVKALIQQSVIDSMAGTFTYQCERLDYYYIADTTGIRKKLATLYASFPAYKPYINIKPDDKWVAYLDFLYPNEETLETMGNQKVLLQLRQAGDKLDKARVVDHWIYFAAESGKSCFLAAIEKDKFKVASFEKSANPKYPFKLHISRIDKVDLESINKITLALRKQAAQCQGDYDGWESVVVK